MTPRSARVLRGPVSTRRRLIPTFCATLSLGLLTTSIAAYRVIDNPLLEGTKIDKEVVFVGEELTCCIADGEIRDRKERAVDYLYSHIHVLELDAANYILDVTCCDKDRIELAVE